MPRDRRIRRALCAAAVVFAAAAVLLPSAVADARTTKRCKSADLRYPFEEGGANTFGVFKLRITGGRCRKAHRVAKGWMEEFEGNIQDGRLELPRRVLGFTFKELPPNAAQTYRLRGRKRERTIRFDYRVPNG